MTTADRKRTRVGAVRYANRYALAFGTPQGSTESPGNTDEYGTAGQTPTRKGQEARQNGSGSLWKALDASGKGRHTLARQNGSGSLWKRPGSATWKRDLEEGRRAICSGIRGEIRGRSRGNSGTQKDAATPQAAAGTQAGQRRQQSDPERRAQPGRTPLFYQHSRAKTAEAVEKRPHPEKRSGVCIRLKYRRPRVEITADNSVTDYGSISGGIEE